MATFSANGQSIEIPDGTLAQLRTLDGAIIEKAAALIVLFRLYNIPLVIRAQGARRTLNEQRALVSLGRSKTANSRHLSGLAFDVDVEGYARDDIPRDFWPLLGNVARLIGLRQPYPSWDPAHLE